MNDKEIIEGNKLIAEFMGYEFKDDAPSLYPDGAFYKPNSKPEDFPEWVVSMVEYHSSWDWLMPVCKKCYDIWIPKFKTNKECKDIFDNLWSGLWHFDIEETYEHVVEFIKWWNEQEKIKRIGKDEAKYGNRMWE